MIALIAHIISVPSASSAKLRRDRVIRQVSASRASLNPSSGETSILHVTLSRAAHLEVQVIDRDGFVIRTLPLTNGVPGDNAFAWDGRDDRGEVVPDEAYSLRVVADGGADHYFPAARDVEMAAVDPLSYSRTTATLTYNLRAPSRLHVQAGTVRGPAGEGPVLKTIVDRQPRGAGTVAEHWSGFDESGSLYVPDLPGFAIAIAATPLPENSVITFGNRKQSFIEYAGHRGGESLFRHGPHSAHHGGLDVFNDLAPRLTVAPIGAEYRSDERLWDVANPVIRLQLRVEGPSASAFVHQPGKIFIYLDSRLVATRKAEQRIESLDIPLPDGGEHLVAINWRSDYGPVAVAVAKVRYHPDRRAARSGDRR
jgi:hypothetical protein